MEPDRLCYILEARHSIVRNSNTCTSDLETTDLVSKLSFFVTGRGLRARCVACGNTIPDDKPQSV